MCVYFKLQPEDVWCHVQVQAPLKAPLAPLITLTAAPRKRLLAALRSLSLCVQLTQVLTQERAHTHMHIVTQSLMARASQRY